ncbi:hypothetical protein CNMCM8980_001503 [Aspergillus fumigatiaffinis]|uniref:Uncharacterized protein n=1 Tax=Aspergillus fumigatiaffinis TaxID=340414 RepID=A0A8H4GWV7_9EURO|nr:hypothetical protein CNMCM5878_002883 [Aspergillus fumigatiaffinis]KAF4219939.1 hypothetical protein CNMCM6457_002764 [Aspergillus fumigatiaffinis]KAF4230206.1 hypothetical protein CNMCM6805_000841 [Aspergillus fumigatiaffinis]KAF4239794.1 hypothetical protein CNMCM8980_001503 [Aspergillus fumigatiaffinis]
MAILEERGASDSSVQPEGSLTAEVTETAAAATLSAADGPDEAAVDKAHPSPPLKRKDISPCDDHPETSQSPGEDAHPGSESEDHQRPPVYDLAQQIKDLTTENLRLQEMYRAISLSMQKEGSRARWIGAFDGVIQKSCERLQLTIFFWAIDYAIGDVNTVDARLSASEKQSIIAALGGYCKQEDWESLMKRFPAKIQKSILQLFAHTLWTKHLFEDVFMKPFLYFDFYEQEEMTSTAGKPDTSLPTKLQNMYQMFRTVDEAQAQVWRSDTVRLANSIVPLNEEANWDGKTTVVGPGALVLGERSKQARRSAVERLVSSILDGPMRLMLRELSSPEEADRRNQLIIDIYCRIAELATTCWADRSLWETRGLDKVATFHWHTETLNLHHFQCVEKDDPRLDGKAVLVVMQPPLYRLGGLDLQFHIDMMIAKGLVIVEEPAST